ncbi:unnamed protein product [Cylicocyclus nassatus]|uniref:RAVE complex protein Rav1 C-terminal domain-containing protein n=1 Tax=Cylicocyclus nassatus TaxID=53992 RepID=A0AA36M380_CYLNA|nr:unnamed protein product [Cylicocyclus nassatus]
MPIPHQVLTGALNRGESVYAVGNTEWTTFIACAVGSNVAVLRDDLSRVQVISGCLHDTEHRVNSVSCCQASGKIAAVYGNIIRIFEPKAVTYKDEHDDFFNHRWVEIHCLTVEKPVDLVRWNLNGMRLTLVMGDKLVFYQQRCLSRMAGAYTNLSVLHTPENKQAQHDHSWDDVWSTQLAHAPKYIEYSPDGVFLAVAGEYDHTVKIFFEEIEHDNPNRLSLGYVTLHHPSIVLGFEWRRLGRYVTSACVQAVLITWCEDKVTRIWKETPLSELSSPDLSDVTGQPYRCKCWSRKIRSDWNKINKKLEIAGSQFGQQSRANVQFHLAATIDVKAVNGVVLCEPLHLHWMNNKELEFDIEIEKLLSEAVCLENNRLDRGSMGLHVTGSPARECSPFSSDLHPEKVKLKDSIDTFSRNAFDLKLEILLGRWIRSTDVLFAVHPVDGSFLTWTVEWLDDANRQAIVSFTSILPAAIPVIDASSIHPTVHTFIPQKYTYNVYRKKEDCEEDGRTSNGVCLLTNHENGSLNLWHMTMDGNTTLGKVRCITHISRMCGHRFCVTQVVAHPLLPLLLTVSQSRCSQADGTAENSEVVLWRTSPIGPLCKTGGVKELARIISPIHLGVRTAWIPALLPKCCFIVSDGENLVIYQANVRVRDLVELDNSTKENESPVASLSTTKLSQKFTSTSPHQLHTCVVEVGRISGAVSATSELLSLHVIPEHIVGVACFCRGEDHPYVGSVVEQCKSASYGEQFFVVLVERGSEYDTFAVHSLELMSSHRQPLLEIGHKPCDGAFSQELSQFYNAELNLESEKICHQRVPLPFGVHITAAVPASGHLPSSSFYPFCQAPFILCTSGDDDVLRFWRCGIAKASAVVKCEWKEWAMINSQSGEVKLVGKIFSISAAYCGRIAYAYSRETGSLENANIADVEIVVFECESSGGIEWMKEDTISLKDVLIPDVSATISLSPALVDSAAEFSTSSQTVKEAILLDWVSTENGSHILIVGTTRAVCIYTQAMCDSEQSDTSVSLLTPKEASSRLVRWVCARVVEIQAAYGLPGVLTSLGCTRDGLLIVGIQSEMRVYDQWNLQRPGNEQLFHHDAGNSQAFKARSHLPSTLNQLQKRRATASNSQLISDATEKTFSSTTATYSLVSDGLFEAARLAFPVLPQYHPKQLNALLHAGKRKRVESILLHIIEVLKQNEAVVSASTRRMSTADDTCDEIASGLEKYLARNYCKIDSFPMLPLHVLYDSDTETNEYSGKEKDDYKKYETLFSTDKMDSAISNVSLQNYHSPTAFTAQHNRLLVELLTHTQLPGISDTDQMHLFAIADTLSQFTTDVMSSSKDTVGGAAAHGYAVASTGMGALDECGQRYLMALKRHEYLLHCLPEKERVELKVAGLASSDIIWALHSETVPELLDAISCLQKINPTWDEMRSLGVGWWLKHTVSLKAFVEKLAKAAFQQNQDPMDSSLYYLALKKKTFLSHLFKTVRNSQMASFFMQDFSTEYWKKVAAKNAFVLMSKQRFHHAAAFFLLSGSLKDAVQTILCKCHDLQLAMVVLRLYEANIDAQHSMLKEMLCREVLGQTSKEFEQMCGEEYEDATIAADADKDPFVRSMAYWHLKDYSRALRTLVQEVHRDQSHCYTLSDIFSFYSYLRKHPLVIRQRHTNTAQVASDEQFVAVRNQACTTMERRLYFRAAVGHMVFGCPMLALDVLSQLPKRSNTEDHDAVDGIAQQLKFKAFLRVLTEEMLEIVGSFDGDAVQLRSQLRLWLEKEVEVLKNFCVYESPLNICDFSCGSGMNDGLEISGLKSATERRSWLLDNQDLLRSLISFCALYSGHNHRLGSALFEFSLLFTETQTNNDLVKLSEPASDSTSLPPLFASVLWAGIFFETPLNLIEYQCHDLLSTILDLTNITEVDEYLKKAYTLYNSGVSLSSCLYQSLCDLDQCFMDSSDVGKHGASSYGPGVTNDFRISAPPSRWPENASFGRGKFSKSLRFRQLLTECFSAVTMSLFCYALVRYDSQWLYRLAAHQIDDLQFSLLFGGAGEEKLRAKPPVRPPRPSALAKKFGQNRVVNADVSSEPNSHVNEEELSLGTTEMGLSTLHVRLLTKWVPPRNDLVHFFADKPIQSTIHGMRAHYDSEDSSSSTSMSESEDDNIGKAYSSSYAWQLLRLVLVEQQIHRIRQFLTLTGFDPNDALDLSPQINALLDLLSRWSSQLHYTLQMYPGGCPSNLLPNMIVDTNDSSSFSKKYAMITEENNTPFKSEDPRVVSLKRLWSYLVHQDHLKHLFIRHIFSAQSLQEQLVECSDTSAGEGAQPLPGAFKIFHKDSEPIVAFACNQEKLGWLVVSTGRELQELDLSGVFEKWSDTSSWLYNRSELDVSLSTAYRDLLKENDDYQLVAEDAYGTESPDSPNTAMKITPWIIDRSRMGVQKIFKRKIQGIRKIDSHPTSPYYVTGSSNGSIRVWEWNAGQPVYTARADGQHAKVAKVTFSCNGNKFAAVDGDGLLCLWQVDTSTEHRKPFFSQRCHSKSASDVRFVDHSSTVLITAGNSSGDSNLALWDTLLSQSSALVHSWVAHPEGATAVMYLPRQQTIVSGGRHGDLCLWDIRKCQLRETVRAFDSHEVVNALVTDPTRNLIVAGSSDGNIKIWSADVDLQLIHCFSGEHVAKSGFSLRQVAQSTVQGVQQLYIDQELRLFSSGADGCLKFRALQHYIT